MNSRPIEQPIVIKGTSPTPMVGILHCPGDSIAPTDIGVIIVNGGAQYRAGAHRMFVRLAQHLADEGHTVLRFDFPGQGDSPGSPIGFEHSADHICAAIDELHAQRQGLSGTALLGLCDGASASLLYLNRKHDPRITHLVLINPWMRSELGHARVQVQHYYLQRLLMPDFWRKLLGGRVGWSAVRELAQKVRLMQQHVSATPQHSFQDRMANAWHAFRGPILLLLSDKDLTAQEFLSHVKHADNWRNWKKNKALNISELNQADHTCSAPSAQSALTQYVCEWLGKPS